MKIPSLALVLWSSVIPMALAKSPDVPKRITPEHVEELSKPEKTTAKAYRVEISGMGAATLSAKQGEGLIKSTEEFRYASEFEPPVASARMVTPTTPIAFDSIPFGWSVMLTGKPYGKFFVITGVAEYTDVQLVKGGYGALAQPIYTAKGELLTPNNLNMPKTLTTTTRFQLYAVPGESYEVLLYRGHKAEKHRLTVKPAP